MTLKIKTPGSVKSSRKLRKLPAVKRLSDYLEAQAFKRYRAKLNPRASK